MKKPSIKLTNIAGWGIFYLVVSILGATIIFGTAVNSHSSQQGFSFGLAIGVLFQGLMVGSICRTLQNNQDMLHYLMQSDGEETPEEHMVTVGQAKPSQHKGLWVCPNCGKQQPEWENKCSCGFQR